MKKLLFILFAFITLTVSSQTVNKILSIETADTITYVRYTDMSNIENGVFVRYSYINSYRTAMENAFEKDIKIINDMSKVTRTLYQNLIESLTGFDRLTLNEPNNNNTYKLMDLAPNTLQNIAIFEQAIRNYLNQ